jgi:hypothetical protein
LINTYVYLPYEQIGEWEFCCQYEYIFIIDNTPYYNYFTDYIEQLLIDNASNKHFVRIHHCSDAVQKYHCIFDQFILSLKYNLTIRKSRYSRGTYPKNQNRHHIYWHDKYITHYMHLKYSDIHIIDFKIHNDKLYFSTTKMEHVDIYYIDLKTKQHTFLTTMPHSVLYISKSYVYTTYSNYSDYSDNKIIYSYNKITGKIKIITHGLFNVSYITDYQIYGVVNREKCNMLSVQSINTCEIHDIDTCDDVYFGSDVLYHRDQMDIIIYKIND